MSLKQKAKTCPYCSEELKDDKDHFPDLDEHLKYKRDSKSFVAIILEQK